MIPSKEQWENAWEGLDEGSAFAHFFGKSHGEARNLIEASPELYCEDFMWMPEIPFKFYISSYADYLMSDASNEDGFAAYSFIGLMKGKLTESYSWISECWDLIEPVLFRLSENQPFYDQAMDEGVYSKLVAQIIERFNRKPS